MEGSLGLWEALPADVIKTLSEQLVYIGSNIASQGVAWGGLADGGKDAEVDGQWSVTNPHRFTLGDFRVSEEIPYFILC